MRGLKLCIPALTGIAWLLTSAFAVSAGDLEVELCSKVDPKDRISGILVERTKGQWTVVSRGRRSTVYEDEFQPCPPKAPDVTENPPLVTTKPPSLPVRTDETEELIMEGSGTIGVGVLPIVIEEYARGIGASLSRSNVDELKRGVGQGRFDLTAPGQGKPFLSIVVRPGGSNNGFVALAAKNAQIGLSSRPYSDAEIAKLLSVSGKKSREEIERVLGLDAIVFIAHPSNPVTSLQLCEAAKLFSGETGTWQTVRGDARRVTPYVLTAQSGTYDLFRSILRDNCGVTISANAVPSTSWDDLITSVGRDPGSVGFAALAVLTPQVKALAVKGGCGIENAASHFTVKTEDYPLTRRLFLYTPYTVQKEAQKFIDFLPTAAAQAAVGKSQAVDQTIEALTNPRRASAPIRDLDLQQEAHILGEFEQDIRGAERLSISYRFRFNSAELDSKANEDIVRLAAYFKRQPTRRSILLAGFTDSIGQPEPNRKLGHDRAEVVRRALENVGARLEVASVQVKGYGEILPVACNDTDVGREKNRRVEIWLRP